MMAVYAVTRGVIEYFRGDVFRAVAAYNAGGGAASRWAPDTADPDVFVEAIAYAETREYVKSIYQYHATYRSLARAAAFGPSASAAVAE